MAACKIWLSNERSKNTLFEAIKGLNIPTSVHVSRQLFK